MIWLVGLIAGSASINMLWVASLTYLFNRAKNRLDEQYNDMQAKYYSMLRSQDQLADRLITTSEGRELSAGVREVIRTVSKPWESGAWGEIRDAAKRWHNCNIGASGRRFVIAEVDSFLRKFDEIAVAARVHLDDLRNQDTAKRLDSLLEGVGLIHSREVQID